MAEESQDRIYKAIEAMNESIGAFVEMFPDLTKQVGDLHGAISRVQSDIQVFQFKLASIEPEGKESVATRIHLLETWQKVEIENQREMRSWKMGVIIALIGAAASIIAVFIKN